MPLGKRRLPVRHSTSSAFEPSNRPHARSRGQSLLRSYRLCSSLGQGHARIGLWFVFLSAAAVILCALIPRTNESGVTDARQDGLCVGGDGDALSAVRGSSDARTSSSPRLPTYSHAFSEERLDLPDAQPELGQTQESCVTVPDESSGPLEDIDQVDGALSSAEETDALLRIVKFCETGNISEVKDLRRETVERLAEEVVRSIPREQIAQILESRLHFPMQLTLESQKPEKLLTDLFETARSSGGETFGRTSLVFTDSCGPDGRISGSTHIIPRGAHRVYAVFENAGPLQELNHVVAVWRDIHNNKLTFMECEALGATSNYNYVWLDLSDGWPAGTYQCTLSDPTHPNQPLASSQFRVE
jgi:hypothetical protein